MKGKKLKALSIVAAAVMAMANITASADIPTIWGFDNIEKFRTETVDTHICRNYINLNIGFGDLTGKKLVIKDPDGNIVAKYTTGEKKFSYVREGILDISGMTSPKEIDALKTDSKYVTRAIRGKNFVGGKPCIVTWKNEYLPYSSYESTDGTEVYPLLSSQIYVYTVDNQSRLQDMNETYTVRAGDCAAYVDHSCANIDDSMYFDFNTFDPKIFCEHAGEFLYRSMDKDTYSPGIAVYTERTPTSSSSTGGVIFDAIKKQDHDITYKMYRIKYEDLLKRYTYSSDNELLINYGKEPGKMAVLFASGSMMTYVTPDSEGYMKFWADPKQINSVQFKCLSKDLKGTSGTVTLYRVVKVNPVMTMPEGGLTLYNIPEGVYSVGFEDAADKEGYRIMNSTFTVKNSTTLQTASEMPILKSRLGDVNFDGKIDVEDAVRIVNHINGVKSLTNAESRRADIDKNKVIAIEDAVRIINHINGVKTIN